MTTPNQNNAVGRTVGPRRRPQAAPGTTGFTGAAPAPSQHQVTAPQPVIQPVSQGHSPVPQDCAQAPVVYQQAERIQASEKSWSTALLLGFFLGAFGGHNFYLGYKTRAWWQLGLMVFGVVTSFLIIGLFITMPVSFWAFIEFIMIVTRSGRYSHDAAGRPLR